MNEYHDKHQNPFGHPTEDTTPRAPRANAAVVAATAAAITNIALGLVLMTETTRGAWFLLIVMGFVPAAGGAILLSRHLAPRACSCRSGDMVYSLALTGWFLASTLGLKLIEKWEFIGDPLADDLSAAMLGVFFIISGNRLPKILTPLSASKCDPVRTQRVQRFVGWVFVLAGLALVGIAMLAPDEFQKALTLGTMMSAMIAVIVRKITLPARTTTESNSKAAVMTTSHPGN